MLTKRDIIVLGRSLGRLKPPGMPGQNAEAWRRYNSVLTDVRNGLVPTNRLALFDSLWNNPERPV